MPNHQPTTHPLSKTITLSNNKYIYPHLHSSTATITTPTTTPTTTPSLNLLQTYSDNYVAHIGKQSLRDILYTPTIYHSLYRLNNSRGNSLYTLCCALEICERYCREVGIREEDWKGERDVIMLACLQLSQAINQCITSQKPHKKHSTPQKTSSHKIKILQSLNFNIPTHTFLHHLTNFFNQHSSSLLQPYVLSSFFRNNNNKYNEIMKNENINQQNQQKQSQLFMNITQEQLQQIIENQGQILMEKFMNFRIGTYEAACVGIQRVLAVLKWGIVGDGNRVMGNKSFDQYLNSDISTTLYKFLTKQSQSLTLKRQQKVPSLRFPTNFFNNSLQKKILNPEQSGKQFLKQRKGALCCNMEIEEQKKQQGANFESKQINGGFSQSIFSKIKPLSIGNNPFMQINTESVFYNVLWKKDKIDSNNSTALCSHQTSFSSSPSTLQVTASHSFHQQIPKLTSFRQRVLTNTNTKAHQYFKPKIFSVIEAQSASNQPQSVRNGEEKNVSILKNLMNDNKGDNIGKQDQFQNGRCYYQLLAIKA